MKTKEKKEMEVKYPFFMHGTPLGMTNAYPTHTHGLTEVGWPEFFIDPLAFGLNGNGGRIQAIYRFLSKPGNRAKLEAVLNGKIVEITDQDLLPWSKMEKCHTYCLREVSRSFEGVKLAYPGQAEDESVPMRFVQIWVKGDDFALTDEYYKGGVKW